MFKVVVTRNAEADLTANVDWWSENRSLSQAERWYDAIMQRIYSLKNRPTNNLMAREADDLGVELYNLWFGLRSKQTHRILYTVDDDVVYVWRVLSTRQDTAELRIEE